jgi:hypothetical protein
MFFSGVFTSGFPYVLISVFYVMGLLFHGTGGNLIPLPEQHGPGWSSYPVCQVQELFLPSPDKPDGEPQASCKHYSSCTAFPGGPPVLPGLLPVKHAPGFANPCPCSLFCPGISSRAPPYPVS